MFNFLSLLLECFGCPLIFYMCALNTIAMSTEHRSYLESVELVQNVIVTINNLSFYQTSDNYVTKCALQISKCECDIL